MNGLMSMMDNDSLMSFFFCVFCFHVSDTPFVFFVVIIIIALIGFRWFASVKRSCLA